MKFTFVRGLKIWWGFIWRTMLLTTPLMLVITPLMFWLIPFPNPLDPLSMMNPEQTMANSLGTFFSLWVLMMASSIAVQVLAIRWLLKTQWSDFKLALVALANVSGPIDSTPPAATQEAGKSEIP